MSRTVLVAIKGTYKFIETSILQENVVIYHDSAVLANAIFHDQKQYFATDIIMNIWGRETWYFYCLYLWEKWNELHLSYQQQETAETL